MRRFLIAWTAIILRAQSPADSSTVLHTSTRLVQVNVIVDRKNAPVANLRRDDFILTEQGRPRKIDVFSVESSATSSTNAAPLPPNTFSNLLHSGAAPPNVVIVLLDGRNTRFEDQVNAKRHLVKFLRSVDPKDRIAIYTFTDTLRVLCDFTNTPEELRTILSKFRGSTGADVIAAHPDPANSGDAIIDQFVDQSNQVFANHALAGSGEATIAAFYAIANHVAELPGRKALVWITGGLPFSLASAAKAFNRANLAVYPVDARGLVGLPVQLTAAAPSPRRQQHIAAFGPEGLQTMDQLAELTGGRAFYNTNDLSGALRTAVEDSRVTYTLGFYVDSESLDGKFHELKVQVSVPGLSVRYRKEYLATKERPGSDEESRINLLHALDSSLESSTIPLSAKVTPGDGSIELLWSIDIHALHLERKGGTANGAINVFFVQTDEAGKSLELKQEAYDVRLNKDEYETYLRTGMTYHRMLGLKKDVKALRILVADRSTAAVGSLIVPLSKVK